MNKHSVSIEYAPSQSWNNTLLEGNSDSLHLYHSTFWAERMKVLLGYTPVYISVSCDSELRIMLLCFIQPAANPFTAQGLGAMARNLGNLVLGKKNLIWYGQPIRFNNANVADYTFLGGLLRTFIKEKKLGLSHGEWPVTYKNAIPSGWKSKPWLTFKIDLRKDTDSLFASFKNSARKEIKNAQNCGVTVRRVLDIEELKRYYAFACTCAKRYNKKMFGFQDFSTMWQHLRGWGHFETFVAFHKEKMVGGLSVWADRYSMIEIGSFQSEESFRLKLHSSDIIKWEAMLWGKSAGCRSFDLGGVNPFPSTRKEMGIKQFKEKWSGEESHYLIVTTY